MEKSPKALIRHILEDNPIEADSLVPNGSLPVYDLFQLIRNQERTDNPYKRPEELATIAGHISDSFQELFEKSIETKNMYGRSCFVTDDLSRIDIRYLTPKAIEIILKTDSIGELYGKLKTPRKLAQRLGIKNATFQKVKAILKITAN